MNNTQLPKIEDSLGTGQCHYLNVNTFREYAWHLAVYLQK